MTTTKRKERNKNNCSVPECYNYNGNGISMHRFPITNELLRKKWISAVKITKNVSNYMRVCSAHFERNDFIPTNVPSKRPSLKKCAIPSLKLPQSALVAQKGTKDAREVLKEKKASQNKRSRPLIIARNFQNPNQQPELETVDSPLPEVTSDSSSCSESAFGDVFKYL